MLSMSIPRWRILHRTKICHAIYFRAFFSGLPCVASRSPYELAAGSPPSLRDGDLLRPHRSPYCLRACFLCKLTEKCSRSKEDTSMSIYTTLQRLNIELLATLHAHTGDLNLVRRIVKLSSLVNATPGFTEAHLVTNGASELLVEVFGEAGKHARGAFGVAQLPLGACVEIELIAEVASRS